MRASTRFYAALMTLILLCGHALAAELPRYSLPLGRKLTYSMSSESKNKDGEGGMSSKGTCQLTVVRENPDGSRRVIIRTAYTHSQSFGRGQKSDSPEQVNLSYADVFPDGRALPNPSLGMHNDLPMTLPPLPKDEAQMQKGWTLANEAKLQTTKFEKTKADENEVVFTGAVEGVMNKIYAMTQKYTYHFDQKKGVISKVEGEHSQGYGFNMSGSGATVLASDQMIDAAEVKALAEEFDLFFNTSHDYQEKMREVSKKPEHAEATVAAAKELLTKAKEAAKTPDVTRELANMLTQHERYASYAKESASKFKGILNKPSPDWSATDIDGKPVKLADFRGKVVLMDFWYRGCGWCMYAMPQVMQLSEDYKNKGVVVLGMNTDADEKDARFVIDTMGMKYATIKAAGIPEKYGIQGFPTLVVVDGEGVVRDVHVGYSPNLKEEVGKKIEELLVR
jgi:thiol-disulfide isomerase/thioredoxin